MAHEALIREWIRLQEWLAENREGLRLHRHITRGRRAQLPHGFAGGRLEQEDRRLLRAFLDTERVRVVAIDEETAERYAAIRDHLRRQGTPIPTNDLWIAASAAQHGLTVLSLDKHFKDVPQILLLYFAPLT